MLPDGWHKARIGDLFESWGGHTPSKSNRDYWGDGLPWVSSKDVKASRQSTSTYTVTEKAVRDTGLRICPTGSVLVVVRSGVLAHTLPVSVTELPLTINQDLKAFYSREPLMNEWLALFLRMSAHELLASSRRDGTTVQSVQYPLLKDMELPVPPLEERHKIIGRVEDALTKQASIPLHLSAARRAIERFRQAVLAAACSGRLTADWRETNRYFVSRDLVATAPSDALEDREVPESWTIARIDDIGTVQLGGTPSRKRADYWDGDFPWVSSGEVANCRIASTRETISDIGLAGSSAKLYPVGTVLIAMIGEGKTRGQAAILDIEAATNQNAAGIHADRRFIDPEYLWRWALAEYETTRAAGTGGNQPALSKQRVSDLFVPVPPLAEQAEIVRRIDVMLTLVDGLCWRIDVATQRVSEGSQAVLARAFRGEFLARSEDI